MGMEGMFAYTQSFNSDVSKWDVSKVSTMMDMFNSASSFNGDVSKWDVSNLNNMNQMFYKASSFKQVLCGKWLNSTAVKEDMFVGSSGEICETKSATSFTTSNNFIHWDPGSNEELRVAVENCEQRH